MSPGRDMPLSALILIKLASGFAVKSPDVLTAKRILLHFVPACDVCGKRKGRGGHHRNEALEHVVTPSDAARLVSHVPRRSGSVTHCRAMERRCEILKAAQRVIGLVGVLADILSHVQNGVN